jgi:hypothetical protein
MKPLSRFFLLLILLLVSGVTVAGDFLQLDRAPKPTKLNKEGLPVYSSYWSRGDGLPNDCTEAIGEEGAELYSTKQGWHKLLTAPDKGKNRWGFDQVWLDKRRGVVIVVEAKGRKYRGKNGRQFQVEDVQGQPQASIEWVLAVCQDVLSSPSSTQKNREVAVLVLKKIGEGKLETRIIITNHIRGIPYETWTERAVRSVPDKYKGKSPNQLWHLALEKGDAPALFGDDFNMIKYGNEAERERLRKLALEDK